jgi:hypothetical protein
MVERWRTHVDGGIGFYNSIVAADLNDDGYVEIYVAGSKGNAVKLPCRRETR